MSKSKDRHWSGSGVINISKEEWRNKMPKMSGTVAELPGGTSAVSPATLEKRNNYDEIIRGLPSDFTVVVLEPDEGETPREIMVSLSRSAVRVGTEIMSRNDGQQVFVRLAKPEEAEVKRATRAKLQAQNAKASANGSKSKNKGEPVAV